MKIHVLPGDAMTETFVETGLDGEIVVCRECLVEGDVKAETMEDFWRTRADFIAPTYGEEKEKYFEGVVVEFEKLKNFAAAGSEINLWFEYELFCQVNLWFTINFLRDAKAKIFRVAPFVRNEIDVWKGFGGLSSEELESCFAGRIEFTENDIELGARLWRAYQIADHQSLRDLSENESAAFPYLKQVCRAEVEKNTRPREVLAQIIVEGKNDFSEIFPAFTAKAGVYGFGDAQVRKILAQI